MAIFVGSNRTLSVRFGLNRTEPNSNRLFKNSVEPNRTRTGKVRFDSPSDGDKLYPIGKCIDITDMTTELSLLRYIMTKVNIYEKVEESNAASIIKTVKDYYN